MKKYIFLVLSLCFWGMCMVSCSNENDDLDTNVIISPTNVSMYYDEEKQLTSSNVTNWSSKNDFVAFVDEKGLIKAAHVGRTQIVASNGRSSAICEVVVKPKYDLYDTPILEWGISMGEIQSKETHKLYGPSSSKNALLYDYTKQGKLYTVMYYFINDKLSSIVVSTDRLSYVDVGYYLVERYHPITSEDGTTVFFDEYTKNKITTAIELNLEKLSGETVTMVYYYQADFGKQ